MPEASEKSFRISRILFWGCLWLLLASAIAYGIGILRSIPEVDRITSPRNFRSSRLYSADHKLLAHLHRGENRESIPLTEVSPAFIQALIATEDQRFYEHAGIDPRALPAVLYRYLFRDQVSGASTLSMQLARNLFEDIGRERSVRRKLREIATALRLERHYTKTELLELYLNTVNIYGNCYGVETAARRLFGKSASELKTEEAALMVGLLKGQGRYNPRTRPELARQRRNTVLQLLADQQLADAGFIDSLQARPIWLVGQQARAIPKVAPYFVERARLWLENWAKTHGYDLYRDGLEAYATLDTRVQKQAEAAVRGYLPKLQAVFDKHIQGKEAWREEPSMLQRLMRQSDRYAQARQAGLEEAEIKQQFEQPVPMRIFSWEGEIDTTLSPLDSIKYYSRFLEVGLCAVEAESGEVKAWVGGPDYRHFRYDHVELSKRQTGSTFKPFVYAAALDNGKYPCERYLNQRVTFDYADDELDWTPKNVSNNLGGLVSLRQALKYSYNIVTARLTKELGADRVAAYAQAMGIQTPIPPYPSICLGTTELNVLEMTGAYATFANEGQQVAPFYIKEIRDAKGKVIYRQQARPKQVLPTDINYAMVDMLKAAGGNCGVKGGLKNSAGKAVSLAGKTGTTQDQSDGWFVGFSPELVAGVWVGCAERKMRFRSMTYGQGAYMARPIFGAFMKEVYQEKRLNFAKRDFRKPPDFDIPLHCWKADSDPRKRAQPKEARLPQGMQGWEGEP
jgi:penicillin-binding protein 1A